MIGRLTGKSAFVTAAGQGIGQAIALAFASEGAEVLATDINTETLKEIENTDGITTQVLDVMDADAISAIANERPQNIWFTVLEHNGNSSVSIGELDVVLKKPSAIEVSK